MDKKCVFCGLKPKIKTKEHILPKWLLEFTGDPNRIANFGNDWSTGKVISFSYDSLVFPSCESCNEKYSQLENESKRIIGKVFDYDYLDTSELTTLLDWFDKIRVGLWLGYQYLSKGTFGVIPKFHIDQRIRQKDRFLIINDLNNFNKGLTIIGVNGPFFQYYPICFTLVINNKVFTNVSSDFVVAHSLGLPYPKVAYVSSTNPYTQFELTKGKLKLRDRIIRFPIIRPYAMLGQAIATNNVFKEFSELYNDPYIISAWQKDKKGLGKIFTEIDGDLNWLDESDEFKVDLRDRISSRNLRVALQTFELQTFLHENSVISDLRLNEEHRSNYRLAEKVMRDFNKMAVRRL